MINIGDTLFKVRMEKKLSRTELAKISGYSTAQIRAYETNEVDPKFNAVQDMLWSMDCNIVVLRGNKDQEYNIIG